MKYRASTPTNIPLEHAEADVAAVLEQALDHQLDHDAISLAVKALGPHRAAAFGSAALLGLAEATATAAGAMILAEQAAERPSPGPNAVTAGAGTPGTRAGALSARNALALANSRAAFRRAGTLTPPVLRR